MGVALQRKIRVLFYPRTHTHSLLGELDNANKKKALSDFLHQKNKKTHQIQGDGKHDERFIFLFFF